FSLRNWKCAPRRRSSGRLRVLELLLFILCTVASLTRIAIFWGVVDPGPSSRFFPHRGLFGIALSHGVGRFYLLEQQRRASRENLGGAAWDFDVGDPHCRRSMRGISAGAQNFCDRLG